MNKIKAIGWAFSLAWRFNKKALIGWFTLLGVVSLLPAIALEYNKKIISLLSEFTMTGYGGFQDVFPYIVVFGIITSLIGLSNRLNNDLIYMMMFDSYYFGMEEVLMDAVQNFSFEELLKKDAKDEYYSVFLREGSLTDFISGLCALFGKFINIFSLIIVAFSISSVVSYISIVYVIGIVWLNMIFVEKLRYSWHTIKENQRLSNYYESLPFITESAKEMRIYSSLKILLDRWRENYKAIYNCETKYKLAVELRIFVSGLGFYIFLAAMVIYSLFAVADGTMKPDVLLVIFTLCLNIFTSVSGVAKNLMITDHGLFALERQYKIFAHRTRTKDQGSDKKPEKKSNDVFSTQNLCYSYKNDIPALINVNFRLHEGETVALVGSNGSGKSTLVKLLLKLYKPEHGNIHFYGTDITEIDHELLRNKIGVFFQDFFLFHTPIKENVGYGDIKHIDDEQRIYAAMEKGGSLDYCKKLPLGIDTYIYRTVEKSGVDFSGGEKQKIAVSRAHMSDKDILIFDEPASMLDLIAELEQFMNIKEKIRGRTAVLISHRVGFARLADRIVLMDNGEIKEEGTHEELIKQNGLYAKFFYEQAMWYQKKNESNVINHEA